MNGNGRTKAWRFLVIEGLDGSGKSTIGRALAARCGAEFLRTPLAGFDDIRARMDRAVGDRGLARTLWYATHVALASRKVADLVAAGKRVVIDRYWMSTLAYAAAQGHAIGLDEVLGRLTAPDATIMLDVPSRLRRARITGRGKASTHDLEFMESAAEARLLAAYRGLGRHPAAGTFIWLRPGDAPVDECVDMIIATLSADKAA